MALRLARHSLLQTLQPLRPVASFPDAGLVTSVVLPQTASASLFYISTPKGEQKKGCRPRIRIKRLQKHDAYELC